MSGSGAAPVRQRLLTIVRGVREALLDWRRERLGTVCARVAWLALLCGPSTSPLEAVCVMPSETDTSAPPPGAPQSSTDEPRSVKAAVLLLGTSLTLAVVVLLVYLQLLVRSDGRPVGVLIASVLLVVDNCFFLWLIRSIGRQHKWPRFFLLVVIPLSWVSVVLRHDFYLSQDIATRGLLFTKLALDTAALCLLFLRSARHWSQTASNNRWRGP